MSTAYIFRSTSQGQYFVHGAFSSLEKVEEKFKEAILGNDPIEEVSPEIKDLVESHWETLKTRKVILLGFSSFWLEPVEITDRLDSVASSYLYNYKSME